MNIELTIGLGLIAFLLYLIFTVLKYATRQIEQVNSYLDRLVENVIEWRAEDRSR
jgi:hypothetical protein